MKTYYYIGSVDGYLIATKDRNNQLGIHAFSDKAAAVEEAKKTLIDCCKTPTGGSDVDTFAIYSLNLVAEVGLSVRPEVIVNDYETG